MNTMQGIACLLHEDKQVQDRGRQYMQAVGSSASECDTIPGRQCMAAVFYHMKQYDDVIIYLKSIKDYMTGDQFNWNLGTAYAASGNFKEGLEALENIKEFKYRYLIGLEKDTLSLGCSCNSFTNQAAGMLKKQGGLCMDT